MTTPPPTQPVVVITCHPANVIPGDVPRLASEYLTAEEAASWMRLRGKDPVRGLERYCKEFAVLPLKVGNYNTYPLAELKRMRRELWNRQHPSVPYPTAE